MRDYNIIHGKKGKSSAPKYEQKVESSKTWTDKNYAITCMLHVSIIFWL